MYIIEYIYLIDFLFELEIFVIICLSWLSLKICYIIILYVQKNSNTQPEDDSKPRESRENIEKQVKT